MPIVAAYLLDLAKSISLGEHVAEKHHQVLDLFKTIFYNRNLYCNNRLGCNTIDY